MIEPVDLAISGRTADAATQQLGQGRERVQELERGRGSLLQLPLNIVVLIVVGVMTLRSVRLLWRRISNRHDQDA